MSDKEEEKEIWKQYPDYDFIEVSNLGRVRTTDRTVMRKDGKKLFVKGHILKQNRHRYGYLYVDLSTNGKHFSLSVHRMVAITFLPNPNNYPEVNHKDNDPTNNRLENLEWCTHEYNVAYKEKYGVSSAEATGRPVYAVNLKTGKVLYFETQSEAARQLGISQSNIATAVKSKHNTLGGCWFTEDESEITEEKIKEIRANMYFYGGVIAVNLDTFEVFYFESQHEAGRQLCISQGSINHVVKGKLNKIGGYWFTYADENAVEKARAMFGDNVARKVEELMCRNQINIKKEGLDQKI